MPQGAVFSSVNFLSMGTRAAVDQALYRMMRSGVLARVARGLYAAAGQSIQAQGDRDQSRIDVKWGSEW